MLAKRAATKTGQAGNCILHWILFECEEGEKVRGAIGTVPMVFNFARGPVPSEIEPGGFKTRMTIYHGDDAIEMMRVPPLEEDYGVALRAALGANYPPAAESLFRLAYIGGIHAVVERHKNGVPLEVMRDQPPHETGLEEYRQSHVAANEKARQAGMELPEWYYRHYGLDIGTNANTTGIRIGGAGLGIMLGAP